jgi:hypothetical protein
MAAKDYSSILELIILNICSTYKEGHEDYPERKQSL